MIDKVVNKRSHNLVVVQSPATVTPSLNEDVLVRSIELAKYAIRRSGIIVVCCPNPAYRPVFDRMIDQQFRGMEQVCVSAGIVGFRYDE
jgi:ribosomal protein L36